MADSTPPDLDLPDELADWRAIDIVDTSTYGEAYFTDLAAEIEAAVDAETVTPLRRWRVVAAVATVAAALIVAVLLRPSPEPPRLAGALEAPPESLFAGSSPPADELIELAKSIGRAASNELFDEEVDTLTLYASADWLEVEDDDVPGTFTSLLEQLDELPSSDLDDLFTPL